MYKESVIDCVNNSLNLSDLLSPGLVRRYWVLITEVLSLFHDQIFHALE